MSRDLVMKERIELIKNLEEYRDTFAMGFDSSHDIERLIENLKAEESEDQD